MARQSSLPSPATSSPSFRRRRIVWSFILSFFATLLFIYRSDTFASHISSYFRDSPSTSHAKVPLVSEIHGLQHFVINSVASLSDIILEAPGDEGWELDPKKGIDLRVYASFNNDQDWEKHVTVLEKSSPVVVFSKTYCPYSRRAKLLLESYQLDPPPKVIEVDLREDTEVIKTILTRLTKHSTFPNIILRGTSLGGADDIQALHEQGQLKEIFEKQGVQVRGLLNE